MVKNGHFRVLGGIKTGKRVKKVKNGHFGVLGSILGLRGVDFGSILGHFGSILGVWGAKNASYESLLCVFLRKWGLKMGAFTRV